MCRCLVSCLGTLVAICLMFTYKTNVMNRNEIAYESPCMEIMEIQVEQAVLSVSLTGEGTNSDELM